MNLREILGKTVSAGDELEVQLAPLGDWKQTVEDEDGKAREITQRFDAAACSRVVENFSGEILVDLDHQSVEGGSTRAYAWVTALRNDPGLGLVGVFRLTEAGSEAVNSREYRFVSVCWFLGDDGRPYKLDSVALTNRPNLPVRPVLNRRAANANPAADGGTTQGNPAMEKLKEILGLAPEAADEEVEAAVKGLKERAEALEAQAKEAEAAQFASENSDKCDEETLKNAYLQSPEVAKALVANMKAPKAPEQPQTILNKASAKTPEKADVVKELNKLPAGKARADYVMAHAAELAAAAAN